jgi:hypothetical protein
LTAYELVVTSVFNEKRAKNAGVHIRVGAGQNPESVRELGGSDEGDLYAAVVVGLLALGANGAMAGACPADPVKASFQVWPEGGLHQMQAQTGTHPCGKSLTCYGGNMKHHTQRQCNWN